MQHVWGTTQNPFHTDKNIKRRDRKQNKDPSKREGSKPWSKIDEREKTVRETWGTNFNENTMNEEREGLTRIYNRAWERRCKCVRATSFWTAEISWGVHVAVITGFSARWEKVEVRLGRRIRESYSYSR